MGVGADWILLELFHGKHELCERIPEDLLFQICNHILIELQELDEEDCVSGRHVFRYVIRSTSLSMEISLSR